MPDLKVFELDGPGKYDETATAARAATGAEGILLIVLNGAKGDGFSAQVPLEHMLALPRILRDVADDIERQHATLPAILPEAKGKH